MIAMKTKIGNLDNLLSYKEAIVAYDKAIEINP